MNSGLVKFAFSRMTIQIVVLYLTVVFCIAILWVSCASKSNPIDTNGVSSNQPSRIAGSPYPMSARPDTLFIADESQLSYTQTITIESLQGILAQTKPRIYMINGTGDDYYVWLKDLGANYGVHLDYSLESNFTGLLKHFKNYYNGYITFASSPSEEPVDIAFSLAGIKVAIVVFPVDQQTVDSLNIPKTADVSNETYQQFMSVYQGMIYKHALCFQTALNGKAQYLPDYAIFGRMFFYYNDISNSTVSQIFSEMNTNSALFGWGSDELSLVTTASEKSIMVHASDFCKDLSVLSNFSAQLNQASHVTNPSVIQNVHTVCFLMTDGDNLQWVLGNFASNQSWYASTNRGKVNLGWTISPALSELAPTVLKILYSTEGKNEGGRDYFVAAPSGLGYMYPESYANLNTYTSLTASYMRKADLTIVNVIGNSNPPAIPVISLSSYLNQTQVNAVFYYPYSNYAGCNGQIAWADGKPIITARYNLWTGTFENPQSLAAKLNASSTDITSPDGYSLVAVHVWTNSVGDVVNCVNLLNNNIRVVPPDEFAALIEKNVKH